MFPKLEIFNDHSVLHSDCKTSKKFPEGNPSQNARLRLEHIKKALDANYLSKLVDSCKVSINTSVAINPEHIALLTRLVDSVTSEVGRALVGLSVLQLSVKCISNDQSIRLHKAGGGGSNFSWVEGIPMRVLDKNYITPVLREYGLLKLNSDGFMMTRSLAENYPYTQLYKAAIRGARLEWLELVELIEANLINPDYALRYLITLLLNRSDDFKKTATLTISAVRKLAPIFIKLDDATQFIQSYVDKSKYSARVFEISMHALFQVLNAHKVFGGFLKPLTQMRSANKKHGNIGDIEIVNKSGGLVILEAWDAKYGKSYLRDELNELNEKLQDHPETRQVGFVVDQVPDLKEEILTSIDEIEQLHDVKVSILTFAEWAQSQACRAIGVSETDIARDWVVAFTESLCQMRRYTAPIDEPSDIWIAELLQHSTDWIK